MTDVVLVNRAPVLALWGAVVAERLGHSSDTALTLGKCMAGLNAQKKGRQLGTFCQDGVGGGETGRGGGPPKKTGLGEDTWVTLLGLPVPAQHTPDGLRACVLDKSIDPDKVREYLQRSFGEALEPVREAMSALANAWPPAELERRAYGLYMAFRPQIEHGKGGWGQKGQLSLDQIRELAERRGA
ncbi:MAG: hypothetical protein HYU66_25110 [Armatimonadetes bacterium]|nr:hypothetical protein [Armatimonadota bacterium]